MPSIDDSRATVVQTYRRRADRYDLTANVYYLAGFREWTYRRRAVAALHVHQGDRVVEVGCGTGLNFGLLVDAVGPEGQVLGVDLTDAMLEQAHRRVRRHGWRNVRLVQADAATFRFPDGLHGILSTFALSLVPECDQVVARGSMALAPGGRWVVEDLKVPGWLPTWLVPLLLPTVRPFAVTEEVIARRPWDAIRGGMESSLADVRWAEMYGGFAFLAVGERRTGSSPAAAAAAVAVPA